MKCSICHIEINNAEYHFYCPQCKAYYCDDCISEIGFSCCVECAPALAIVTLKGKQND